MSKAYCITSLPVFFISLIHLLVTLHRWDEINRLAVVILFASIGFQTRQVFFLSKWQQFWSSEIDYWMFLKIWKIYNILWVRCLSHSPEPKLNNIIRHIKCKNESVSDILDSKYQYFLCQHFLFIINYIWCIIIWISW